MSTTQPARTQSSQGSAGYAGESDGGWVLFAGIVIAVLGTMNMIYGIAAVSRSSFFVAGAKFVFSDLRTWGWIMIVIAAVQLATALGIMFRVKGVRWVGITIAALNAIAQLLSVQAYPFWALCLFALDILVIYALAAHGARHEAQRV